MAGYIGKATAGVANVAERKFRYTATAGQTTFTASYTPGSVHVYRTGVRLTDGVDYTATNGSTVVLVDAANAGDDIVIVSSGAFQIADTYTKAETYAKADVFTKAELANHDAITVDNNGNLILSSANASNVYLGGTGTPNTYGQRSLNINGSGASAGETAAALNLNQTWNGRSYPVRIESQFGDGGGASARLNIGVGYWNGSAVAVRDVIQADYAGRVTMPYQPAFSVYGCTNTTSPNVAAAWQYVETNIGNHFNPSTGIFTAPVSGRYYFHGNFMGDNSSTYTFFRFQKNGTGIGSYHHTASQATAYRHIAGSIVIDMQANDTFSIYIFNTGLYGANSTGEGTPWSGMSGYLIG